LYRGQQKPTMYELLGPRGRASTPLRAGYIAAVANMWIRPLL
jgi:hypothetical protein